MLRVPNQRLRFQDAHKRVEIRAQFGIGRAVLIGKARADRAGQSRSPLGPLRVTPEPEQIVRNATRKVATATRQCRGRGPWREQTERADRAASEHPRILAFATRPKRQAETFARTTDPRK